MKTIMTILFLFSISALAQDPTAYLNLFDSKVYSLKTKGVKDFIVDIESSKLTKQVNEQMIFGKVKDLIFRLYWTANPERMVIEILGMPEGFKEVKEELKLSMLSQIDNLLPMTTIQRFAGYKFSQGSRAKEFVGKDNSGIAAVPSYIVSFDNQDKLIKIEGQKPIGSLLITPKYEKESFSDGKWVLTSLETRASENGQSMVTKKELKYGSHQGIGVLLEVAIVSEQKIENSEVKPLIFKESLEFKNYKLNTGEALKHFLGSEGKPTP